MRPAHRLLLAVTLLLAFAAAVARAADAPPTDPSADPVAHALAQLGPWGVAGAAVMTLVVTRVVPWLVPIIAKRAEAESAATASHTVFIQQLVNDFRADLSRKDAAFLAAMESMVGRIHGLELEVARLAERMVPGSSPQTAPAAPTPLPTAGGPTTPREVSHAA